MTRILAIVLTMAACRLEAGVEPVSPGESVPDLSNVRWIRGEPVNRFEQGRIYVMEFWSTWCGACVESMAAMNEMSRRYQKDATFVSIHVWQKDSAAKPQEFFQKRLDDAKPVMEFSVAEDANDEIAKGWLDAMEITGLPTAMIVDRSRKLVWFGHTRDLEKPLISIIDGTFDISRNLNEMKLRVRVGQLANESGKAIESGKYDEGIRLMLEALNADFDTVIDWIPSTYGQLLATSRSPTVAAGFARTVLATDAGNRKDFLAGLAHVILHFRPKELRDLELALTLARKADAMSDQRDALLLTTIAMLRAELGDLSGAIHELEAAHANAPDDNFRKTLTTALNDLKSRSKQ